jgi:hypothetical protein
VLELPYPEVETSWGWSEPKHYLGSLLVGLGSASLCTEEDHSYPPMVWLSVCLKRIKTLKLRTLSAGAGKDISHIF